MSKYLVNEKNKQIFNGIIPRYENFKYVVENDTNSIEIPISLKNGESLKIKTIQNGTSSTNATLYLMPNNLAGSGYSIRTYSSGNATAQTGINTTSDYVLVNGYNLGELAISGYSYSDCQLNLVNGRLVSNATNVRFNNGEQRQLIASCLIAVTVNEINSIKIWCGNNIPIKTGTIFIFEKM